MKDIKIVFVPLDERPCNYRFPLLMPGAGYTLDMLPTELMGLKKRPADTEKIARWLSSHCGGADYAVVSMDMLIYGGLIPSRLHVDSAEELCRRADILRSIKSANPKLKIFAFQTIMRCPRFSLSDEEPDYYADCGAEIHRLGKFTHMDRLGVLTDGDRAEFDRLSKTVDAAALSDYTARREVNLRVTEHTVRLFSEGVIDKLIIPQDDSAKYGFTAMDQNKVRVMLKARNLQADVPVYPAADDTGMTMLCAACCDAAGVRPKIFVYYASHFGAFVTPSFEDRTIDATVKNQILAAGCRRVYSFSECDLVLSVNIGSEMIYGEEGERTAIAYDVERSLPELLDTVERTLSEGKISAVADVAYPTHSDLELLGLLSRRRLLMKIHAYAGWNTSSNTLGTVICQSVLYMLGRDLAGNEKFLLHRYYDDAGYCSHTRTFIDVNVVPKLGKTVFELDGTGGECAAAARRELLGYMAKNFPEAAERVSDISLTLPWNRTFEADIDIILRADRGI